MKRPEDILANRIVEPLGLPPLSGRGERLYYLGEEMPTPLATIHLRHSKLELWPSHCRTVFPDGRTVEAAPNEGETITDCVAHELAHHLISQAMHDKPSACLRAVANGDGNRWTPRRREEEEAALSIGPALVEAVTKIAEAYGVNA